MKLKALGSIIEWSDWDLTENDLYSGMFDYWDHWESIDPRLTSHYTVLSAASDAFGHDIVNLATFTHEILNWLDQSRIQDARSVVAVSAMTEAFMYTVRTACDVIASALAEYASEKPGQVPKNGLRDLLSWSQKNETRLRPAVTKVLTSDFDWFWKLRSFRDALAHRGANANIASDGRQFYLWLYGQHGWITREPLLPLINDQLRKLLSFADQSAHAINLIIGMPADRIKSRVLHGILIPSLHDLSREAPNYSNPSP
ncbi:hypothetical protein [Rhodoplanes sp. SY1]|uniref:hypothetical protein n=1 Tax=Rhodoplanes sp. SY1 TaxID=3166646 RepID=UPI0038B60D01